MLYIADFINLLLKTWRIGKLTQLKVVFLPYVQTIMLIGGLVVLHQTQFSSSFFLPTRTLYLLLWQFTTVLSIADGSRSVIVIVELSLVQKDLVRIGSAVTGKLLLLVVEVRGDSVRFLFTFVAAAAITGAAEARY